MATKAMNTKHAFAIGLAFALVIASAAYAQMDPPPAGPAGAQVDPAPSKPAGAAPGAPDRAPGDTVKPMVRPAEASHPLEMVRLSDLDGVNIFDAQSKKIGEVDDVLVDPGSAAIQQAIVSVGGVVGIGAKKYSADLADLQFFSEGPDRNEPVKATLGRPIDGLTAAGTPDKESPVIKGDKYTDVSIVDMDGKKIGEVEDAIVDLRTGKTVSVLIEFNKEWSPDRKLFVFSPSELMPGEARGTMQITATRESLDQRPSIESKALGSADLGQLAGGTAGATGAK